MKPLFGTDGIRGQFNSFPMDVGTALQVGQATVSVIRNHSFRRAGQKLRILIGRDTRASGPILENALSAGLCSSGADVYLLGCLPTAAVSFATTGLKADAGIMITASHNPQTDNGIKIFGGNGYKISDFLEREIEKNILQPSQKNPPPSSLLGKAIKLTGFDKAYATWIRATLPHSFSLQGTKIALDCAHGAAHLLAPGFLKKTGAILFCIGNKPNGQNINAGFGSEYPEQISKLTVDSGSKIGIAFDGDADRCLLSDETGSILNGDEILGIFALWMHARGTLKNNRIATTVMSNLGLESSLRPLGIELIRTPVGDRHVISAMRNAGITLGGEPSGHLVFLNYLTTGDGLLAALKMLEVMQETGTPLSSLRKRIRLWPQVLESIRVTRKEPFEKTKGVSKAIQTTQAELEGRGRVFVRYSGTEPLARVLIEGEDLVQIRRLSQKLVFSIQSELGVQEKPASLSA